MEFGRLFGFLHPALVHFPLVLLILSVGMEIVGFVRRDSRFTWAAQVLLILGSVWMLLAFVAGNFAELWAARTGVPLEAMERHELLATITSWIFIFLTIARFTLKLDVQRTRMAIYLLVSLGACVLLGVTGHYGAMLVVEHGAGVQASARPPVPSHEDLKELTQKQSADDIFYSNKMHHLFGGMTLLLALMLFVDTASPKAGDRLRKIGPLLLLIGGVYLMIFSDTDSWPLSSIRPVTDKEVLVHKTYATLMLLIGLRGLFRRRGAEDNGRKMQNRTMALFALVGGGMLFTHVHSGAAYANVAVGVYVHHTVMGFVALCIGAVKLLEEAMPPESPWRRRGWVWVYPALMLGEAILLLGYNEGLPWFLGYPDLRVNAPHGGLIAHLGKDRAELTFVRETGTLKMYVLGRDNDRPLPLPSPTAQAILRVGAEPTLVNLSVGQDADGSPFYTGNAAFVRNEPLFQAQVYVPGVSVSRKSAALVADFEPVVDRARATGRTKAAFICPMHEEVGAASASVCPRCGMNLVPNRPPRPWPELHDEGYRMELVLRQPRRDQAGQTATLQLASDTTPERTPKTASAAGWAPVTQPAAGQPTHLTFTPRRADGSLVSALDVVHTKKLHLILVSADLSFFDHVHPVPQPDGSLTLDYTFPQAGEYVLYVDLTPKGDRNQVFRLPVTAAGPPPARQPLMITPVLAKLFGDCRVALKLSPAPAVSNDETYLTFSLSENGVPITDLEPFLGAGGHCVILSEDTQSYLHSHPAEIGEKRFGPDITFHTTFPRPGRYKVWGQFLYHGKPLTADFVIEVGKK